MASLSHDKAGEVVLPIGTQGSGECVHTCIDVADWHQLAHSSGQVMCQDSSNVA